MGRMATRGAWCFAAIVGALALAWAGPAWGQNRQSATQYWGDQVLYTDSTRTTEALRWDTDGLKLRDDLGVIFGDAPDYEIIYDSGDDRLEVRDSAAAVILAVADALVSAFQDLQFAADDTGAVFGADGDYRVDYDSGTDRLEVRDAGGNLLVALGDALFRLQQDGQFPDDKGIVFGTDSDYRLDYDSGNNAWELRTGGGVLLLQTTSAQSIFSQILTAGNGTGTATLRVRGGAGSARDIALGTGTNDRWILRVDNTAESGSDAGSSFQLLARTDAGAAIDTVMSIVRAAGGPVTWNRPQSITGSVTATGRVRSSTVTTFTANDTSPSVSAGNTFKIPGTWTAANNITAFDDGAAGQRIVIIGGDDDCVVEDGGTLALAGNWTASAGDVLELVHDGTGWYEVGRSDN